VVAPKQAGAKRTVRGGSEQTASPFFRGAKRRCRAVARRSRPAALPSSAPFPHRFSRPQAHFRNFDVRAVKRSVQEIPKIEDPEKDGALPRLFLPK
jgi:hypothetical protein